MSKWRKVFIIGTDLTGRKCRVAQVQVPAHLSDAEALRYVQRNGHPVVSEIESE